MIKYTDIMSDYFSSDYAVARETIFQRYMPALEKVKESIESDEIIHSKYMAYRAFISREFEPILLRGKGKAERKNRIREIGLLWLQRYLVFKSVCEELFPNYFRLSVLSYTSQSASFSINLIANTTHFGMPWFHVLVKHADNTVELKKKYQAEEEGCKVVYFHGKPWYFKDP